VYPKKRKVEISELTKSHMEKGKYAVTFCAASKRKEAKEGTPKELWKDASPRISSFIEVCERNNIPYCIFSYKYGLVRFDEVIDNYDISKKEVDLNEWSELVRLRAKELGVKKLYHVGLLAFASPELRKAIENTGVEVVWCDSLEELVEHFVTQEKIQEIKDVHNYDPRQVSDRELTFDHALTHRWWNLCHTDPDFPYSCDLVKKLHDAIADEMIRRGFVHNTPLKEVKQVSGLEAKLKEAGIKYELVGESGKVDLPEDLSKVSDEELKGYHLNAHRLGDKEAHDKIVAEMERRGMNHDSPIEEEGENEEAPSSASLSSLQLLKHFTPLKPTIGYKIGEVYGLDALKELVNFEHYPTAVEKKMDGFRVIVHKKDGELRFYSEDGIDVKHRFPWFVERIKKINHDIILDTEMELWDGGVHQSREIASGYARREEPAKEGEDHNFVMNVFDILWYDKDIHELPLEERKKYLKKIKFDSETEEIPKTPSINLVPWHVANNDEELIKWARHVSSLPGSEGAVVKSLKSPYELDGESRYWYKYKKHLPVDVAVLEQIETKRKGTFIYKMGLKIEEHEVPKEDIHVIGGKRYAYVGNSMNTTMDLKQGDSFRVSCENVFVYPNGRVRLYLPIPDKEVDNVMSVDEVIEIAKESGLLVEKTSAQDPFLEYPDESKSYRFVAQHHWRGKSVHLDLRFEANDHLVGWTVMEQPDDAVDEPVLTLEDAKRMEDKLNWKLLKQNEKVLVAKKAKQPKDWLKVEGVVPKGGIGSTREFPGVFLIIDSGKVEFGAQKSDFHEYFLHGKKLKGRFVVRLIPENQRASRSPFIWIAWFPEDQTPYVLSRDAVKKGWMPPKGVSTLPKAIRDKIPKEYRYWEADRPREVRDKLVEAIKAGEVKLYEVFDEHKRFITYITDICSENCFTALKEALGDQTVYVKMINDENMIEVPLDKQPISLSTKFTLQFHWWRGPQIVREGPTARHWDLWIYDKPKYHFVLDEDPIVTDAFNAMIESNKKEWDLIDKGKGEAYTIEPGEPGNPTKNTPAYIKIIDEGTVVIWEDGDLLKKFEFKGKYLKKTLLFTRNPNEEVWEVRTVDLAPKTETKLSVKLEEKGWVIEGTGLAEGVWNGLFFPKEVIMESYKKLINKPADIWHDRSKEFGFVKDAWLEDGKLKVKIFTTKKEVVDMIENGELTSFSIDAWIYRDPDTNIVKKILDYEAITLTSMPACKICDIEGCEPS